MGGVFAAMQFVDLTAPLATLRAATGIGLVHTPDPTDLLALAVLPLGVAIALCTPPLARRWLPVAARPVVLALSLVAVAGTAAPLEPRLFENEASLLEQGRGPDEVFAAVEDALRSADVSVRTNSAERVQRVRHEDDVVEQAFKVSFEHSFPADAFDPPATDPVRTVSGWLLLSYNLNRGTTRIVDDWGFDANGSGRLDREVLERAVRERVLRPIQARNTSLTRI